MSQAYGGDNQTSCQIGRGFDYDGLVRSEWHWDGDRSDEAARLRCSGAAELSTKSRGTQHARAHALCDASIPHVCAGPAPAGGASPFVMVDGRAGALTAMRHLIGLGHQRIGLIQLPSELAESEPRYQGYADALASANVALDPALIVEAGRREEDGYQAMGELLGAPKLPTAVLACSDELAFGAMHALYDAGLVVGRDVSLVGFDDLPQATHTHPPLTALRQPRRAVGEHLAALLIDAIERRARAAQSATLGARLIVRRSTGPFNQQSAVSSQQPAASRR